MGELESLRYEPIDKRIRALHGDRTVVDSTRALLVWEPKRVVPATQYRSRTSTRSSAPRARPSRPACRDWPRCSATARCSIPSIPFSVHTSDGEPLTVRRRARGGGLPPADPALDGYVVLDFTAFDAWLEEDERNVAHPRDPFHRIDILHSSRHVRVEAGGEVARRVLGAVPPVRAAAAGPLLPAARGRPDGPIAAERQADVLRLQGPGHLLVGRRRGRRRLELSGSAARGGRGDRPVCVLQRAHRHRRRRRAAGATGHSLVAEDSVAEEA